ncbi:TPA: DNA-binding transcriptional regulator CsiR [Klebsiella pneumoniae]
MEPRQNSALSGYEWLKQDITRGVFQPGEKLLMGTLRARYGLGVGPLREALAQLVGERLVVAVSQKGYRVAPMSLEAMRDIYDARANLEAMVTELAVQRGDDAWEAQVIAHSHTLAKVARLTSSEQMLAIWDERHKAFHSAVAAGCGSPHLLQVRTYLFDQVERYRHLWLTRTVFSEEALEQKRQEHAALVSVILARDAARAAEMMRAHMLTPLPVIAEVLDERAAAEAID